MHTARRGLIEVPEEDVSGLLARVQAGGRGQGMSDERATGGNSRAAGGDRCPIAGVKLGGVRRFGCFVASLNRL